MPSAWMVAAVFAVHPLHVESVAWIIERKDVLSGLFYLAAVLAWMRFVEQPRPGRYACSLGLYAAGLLSKSIVVTLPVALLIWHWWKQGRVTWTDLLRIAPFFVVGLVITAGDLSFFWSLAPVSFDYSLLERALIAARALWFYAGKLLWPTNLSVIYPRWDIQVADPLAWGYLIAAAALVVALWHFRPRDWSWPAGLGIVFLRLRCHRCWALSITAIWTMLSSPTDFSISLVLGSWLSSSARPPMACVVCPACGKRVSLGVAALALVVLGMLTWRQASIYQDRETFYSHIIALNPQARSAHRNLGLVFLWAGAVRGGPRCVPRRCRTTPKLR